MKKLLVVAGMLMAMSGSAAAQGGGMGGGGGRMQMNPEAMDSTQLARLFDGITLNADQTAKAKGIIKAAREAMAGMDRQAPEPRVEDENRRDRHGPLIARFGWARSGVGPGDAQRRCDAGGSAGPSCAHARVLQRQCK